MRFAMNSATGSVRARHEHAQGETVHRSPRSRRLFERAAALAREVNSESVRCGHLFLALLEEGDSTGCRLLQKKGADLKALAQKTRERLEKEPARSLAGPAKADAPKAENQCRARRFSTGSAVTSPKPPASRKLGPIIGRRQEILQVIQTLARRSKNNPVLVGEAGVGKTAVAEAVAIRAAAGKDPQVLGGKRIVELSMTSLVGGTKYRGEFEERVARIIAECRSHPEVIVFH